ncbi:MAG: hypothetical protein ACI841_001224, partial [Planctomycetota bacterium]
MVGREAVQVQLREDLLAVDGNLEGSPTGFDEFTFGVRENSFQFRGQTGRLGTVVSHRAVFDRDLHSAWLAVLVARGIGLRRLLASKVAAASG